MPSNLEVCHQMAARLPALYGVQNVSLLKRAKHTLTPQTSEVSDTSRIVAHSDPFFVLRDRMKDQINQVFHQAQKTFLSDDKTFERRFQKLIRLMNKTTAVDLNLNPQFMTKTFWSKPDKAPVTYIDLYSDNLVTLGVFVLKDGMKLPLHDHPDMHGLVKVLMGKLRIKSFSADVDPEIIYSGSSPIIFTAQKQPDVFADSRSNVCVLRPRSKNIHEIESIGGPAAFFDILSPSYDTPTRTMGTRKCNYFQITGKVNAHSYKLMEIEPPQWFWNDRNAYAGPVIRFDEVREAGMIPRVLSYIKNTRLFRVFDRSRSLDQ